MAMVTISWLWSKSRFFPWLFTNQSLPWLFPSRVPIALTLVFSAEDVVGLGGKKREKPWKDTSLVTMEFMWKKPGTKKKMKIQFTMIHSFLIFRARNGKVIKDHQYACVKIIVVYPIAVSPHLGFSNPGQNVAPFSRPRGTS